MKNLKKVLALAVAFVMCFTMFAGAAVYSDVPAGSDYSEAVTLLSDLGIIAGMPDGSFGVDKTITRADAACLIARMLTGETMPSKYAGASNFTDVPKDAYYESAVAYCAIMGITQGTSTSLGTYSPMRTITDGEFIAMITRALGYDSAANPLSFPMGNIARAQQEGILDNVNVVATSDALRGEDAMMIYNALFADYDEYAKQQNIYQAADEHTNVTIAEKVFGLDRLARVEHTDEDNDETYVERYKNEFTTGDKCLAHTWVVVGVDARDAVNTYTAYPISDIGNEVSADDVDKNEKWAPITFIYEGDPSAILGYQVELWGELDHNGVDEIVKAVKTVKGQTGYDWQLSDGEDGADKLTVSGGTVDAEDALVAVTNLMIEDAPKRDEKAYIHTELSNEEYSAFDLVAFYDKDNDFDYDFKDGDSYRLVDWDSDGKIDFGIKTVRKYAEITDIDSETIAFSGIIEGELEEVDFDIDDDQLKFNCAGIQEGDVVEITATRAYSKSADGEVVTVNVEKISSQIAELTKVSTKGELQMTFDGVVRELADEEDRWDLVENEANNLDESDLEGTYEIWLDENGFIVKLEESDTNTGYLVVLETENGSQKVTQARSDRAALKVKLDDNTVAAYEVAFDLDIVGTVYDERGNLLEKRNINNTRYYNAYNVDTKKATDKTVQLYSSDSYQWLAPELVVGQVYKYWMDSEEVITKLQRITESKANEFTYWPNTGVVQVSDDYPVTGFTGTATDFNNKPFNGNVYLKNSDVLFITDTNFVQINTDGEVWADEDDVMAIEPTTANLKAISIPSPAANVLTLATGTNISSAPSGYNIPLYRTNINGGRIYNVAYDIDKNNYATAAIMAIENFDEFNKNTVVALMTDASAQNRKNTVFEIDGAVAGKVGTFTSVEEEGGVPKMFYYYDPKTDGVYPYDSLTQVRADINNNALYAEISLNSDGKVTRVIVMTAVETPDGTISLMGDDYAVVRLGAGIDLEVAKAGTAAFITGNSAENILRYASKDELMSIPSVQWPRSFDVTGDTNIYTISNKLSDVMEGVAYEYLQSGDKTTGLTKMTDEPKISEATADKIVSSTNKNSSRNAIDKYAVMDVAFDKEIMKVTSGTGVFNDSLLPDDPYVYGWNTNSGAMGDALNGKDAVAVFSYTKRFGESDAADDVVLTSVDGWEFELNKEGLQDVVISVKYEVFNGAVVEKIELYKDGVKQSDPDTNTAGVIKFNAGTFNNGENNEWKLVVTDNKGNTIEQEIKVVPYDIGDTKFTVDKPSTMPEAAEAWNLTFSVQVNGANPEGDIEISNATLFTIPLTKSGTSGSVTISASDVAANTVKAGTYTLTFRDKTSGAKKDVDVIVKPVAAATAVTSATATADGKVTLVATAGWQVSGVGADDFTIVVKTSTGNEENAVISKFDSSDISNGNLKFDLDASKLHNALDTSCKIQVKWTANGYCEGGETDWVSVDAAGV